MKSMARIALGVVCLGLLAVSNAPATDTGSFDLNWYGSLKLDGSWDENLTSHGNYVMWINPRVYNGDDEQFNMTANETRFGLSITGDPSRDIAVSGQLEFDLYAGAAAGAIAENQAMLQLRHAYFTLEMENTRIVAGQTWDMISPLNPTTLNYSVLWGCGNIGYRRPQISLWHTLDTGPVTEVTVAAGFYRTIGSDLTPTFTLAAGEFSDGDEDGADAGIPSFQGLCEVDHQFASGTSLRLGASALWGRLKAETTLGNSATYKTWAASSHMALTWPTGFGISSELFTGENLGSYYGGILNTNVVDGLATVGGWVSVWMSPSDPVKLSAGIGMDDPDDDELGVASRAKNRCVWGNIRYAVVPQATIGFELSQWKTQYKDAGSVASLRAQTSFILEF
ncbi:MAG TPA: hypothetical protein VMY05_01620 [Acidobacteriota bacterium]|nr:hypothetical protein [Acidobacteriota bacterium]